MLYVFYGDHVTYKGDFQRAIIWDITKGLYIIILRG